MPLDIEATNAAIDINNTSSDPLIHFQLSGTTNFTIGTDLTDSKFKIGTTALETGTALTVQSTGEVGVGTTSPTAKFEVDGSAIFNESHAAVDFRVEGDTEANLFFVDGSADRVGVGTATPSSLVEISSGTDGDAVLTISADTDDSNEADNPKIELLQDGGNYGGFLQIEADAGTFATNTLANACLIGPSGTSGSTLSSAQIVTNGVARLTVEPSGEVGIGTNTPSEELEVVGQMRVESTGVPIAYFNRSTSDGWLLVFEGDGTTEGTISIAGTTISYNAFTGSHYAFSKDKTFERGMLVSFNDSNEHFHNNPESEILYGIDYTAKPNDSRVAGVFLNLSESTKEHSLENPYQIMAVGNGDVWVTDEGGNITTGDYLISSSVVGHAMKDNGDYEVSHVFAKATESVDWSTVQPDFNGVKRKKIIVYFESFDKPNYEKKFREQQAIIEDQKRQIEENAAANAEKLNILEAKINALLEKETASK